MLEIAGACGLGAAAGAACAGLWLAAVPHAVHGRFWSAMRALSGELLRADEFGHLLPLYRRLGGTVGAYAARNFGGVLLTTLPLAVLPLVMHEAAFFAGFGAGMLGMLLWPRRS